MSVKEASVDFSDVRGRCTVVYSEEMNKDRDMDFTSGEDKFYFSEVWCYLLLHTVKSAYEELIGTMTICCL